MVTFLLSKYIFLAALTLILILVFAVIAIKAKLSDSKLGCCVMIFFLSVFMIKFTLDALYIYNMPKDKVESKYYGEF